MGVVRAAQARPRLRLVSSGLPPPPDRDASVAEAEAWRRAPCFATGAAAFLAGEGARLYSLDAFRFAGRGRGPGHSPHAA